MSSGLCSLFFFTVPLSSVCTRALSAYVQYLCCVSLWRGLEKQTLFWTRLLTSDVYCEFFSWIFNFSRFDSFYPVCAHTCHFFFIAQTRKDLVVQDLFFSRVTRYSHCRWLGGQIILYVFLVHVLFSLFSSCVCSALLCLTLVSIIS